MHYTMLGRTGLLVSRICLGTMNFGNETDEPASFAIMDRALELGVNFFDTADVYGHPRGNGVTEELIGRWLAQGGRREKIVLATKCFGPMGKSPLDQGLSARHIRLACDASLRRMQTDYIDLYQMHHIDRGRPAEQIAKWFGLEYLDKLHNVDHGAGWDEIWQALDQLVTAGKVLYVGSSNFAGWNIAQANTLAAARHTLGLVSEQSKYSLNARMVELEVVPACKAFGLGLIPWSPLGGGVLAGMQGAERGGRRVKAGAETLAKYKPQMEAYQKLCGEIGHAPSEVALAWLLHQPVVTAPIVGPRTMDQLLGNLKALDVQLSPETLKRLDQIWPGPGGQAPEAYAW